MNANAKKWVEALRSGAYKQIKRRLRNYDNTAYCCMGVLCDLASRAGITDVWPDHICTAHVPHQVAVWAGLKRDNASYADIHSLHSLADYNDDGKSFQEIADIIEANESLLFEPGGDHASERE